ncbi:MAG: RsiV family protein, partial [Helicobacter sp.]|nr:RsiV family protein [Helicobacter sp.]
MRIFLVFLAVCGILWAKSPKAIEISYKTYTLGENAFLYMASAAAPKGKVRFLFAGLGGLAQQGCHLGESERYFSNDTDAPSEGEIICGENLKAHFAHGALENVQWQGQKIAPTFREFRVQRATFAQKRRKTSMSITALCSNDAAVQDVLQKAYNMPYQCATMPQVFDKAAQKALKDDVFEEDEVYDAAFLLEIVYFDSERIVFEEITSSYTGGAHASHVYDLRTFSLNGEELDCTKALLQTNLPKLKQRLLQEVQKYGTAAFVDEDSSDFEVSKIIAPTYNGIAFLYQPYEILPYSFGAPRLIISYDEAAQYFA